MITDDEITFWRRGADHYAALAGTHTGASQKLACLTLAAHCVFEWSCDRGGPTQEMIQLAESLLGVTLDRVIKGLMAENTPAHPEHEGAPMITVLPPKVDKK